MFAMKKVRNDINHLDVASLRDQLEAANLEVDKSREVLEKRLEEHGSLNDIKMLKCLGCFSFCRETVSTYG